MSASPLAPRSVAAHLREALGLLAETSDLLEERPTTADPPPGIERRRLAEFLSGITDAELERCEAAGLSACLDVLRRAPASLAELAESVGHTTRLPELVGEELPIAARDLPCASSRKRAQLAALFGRSGPLIRSAVRIVDVGAGHGHATRLAADRFERPAVGIERRGELVRAALALAAHSRATFREADAMRESLALTPNDLALGLHACGELADRVVVEAASAGADVLVVSCCLQKIGGERRAPLSSIALSADFRPARELLGLSNLLPRAAGVEAPTSACVEARMHRHALALLLRARGVLVSPGEAMRGINRRKASGGLAALASAALSQRGLAPATAIELAHWEAEGRREFARIRRFSLPRSMLARVLEVAVALDRATYLFERGATAAIATGFDERVSPRNLVLLASRVEQRIGSLSMRLSAP